MASSDLTLTIKANSSAAEAALARVIDQVNKMANQTDKDSSRSSAAFDRISAAAVAVGNVIANVVTNAWSKMTAQIDNAIKRFDTMNNFPRVMENLGIASDKSAAAIAKIADKLKGLPTALDSATLSVQRLVSKNGDIDQSVELFLAMNNAILAGGAPMDLQRAALEQLTQAYTKGKPDMMEWRSMMSAMPAQLKQVAAAMGYVNADALGEALRNGSESMDAFMDTFVRLNKEGIEGFASFEQQCYRCVIYKIQHNSHLQEI
ncbi:tape measure protein [Candidatus Saccharibacteria bacterium]|nr:tape measure protein [Candidatus Saccharibacteria bacterium]